MPNETKECIETWKKIMPDYELILWDKNKFNIDSVIFTKEACSVKKWAFAADYIRIYAIYTEGGIYMDTDVYVKKSFDDFLHNGFFSSLEYHEKDAIKHNSFEFLNEDGTIKNSKNGIFPRSIGMQAAVLGGIKEHPFLKSCLDWYQDKHFILPNGSFYNEIIAPSIYANIAIKYGFRYKNEFQKLKHGMVVYPSYIFAGAKNQENEETYAIHYCNGSWREKPKKTFLMMIKQKLSKNKIIRQILGKPMIK